MDTIVLNSVRDGDAIAEIAGTTFDPRTCTCFCRVKDGERMGGIIFSGFTGESIGMHSAAWHPRWINRDMLFVAFDYPFRQLGVKRIFGQVPEDNHHARKFNEKVGFRYVARVEGVFPGNVACMVMRLDMEDCHLLRVKPRTIVSNKVFN